MLKWVSVLMNVGVIGFIAVFVFIAAVIEGKTAPVGEWIGTIVIIAIPAINLLYIFSTRHPPKSGDDESILDLWLRVKKAELRKRLD